MSRNVEIPKASTRMTRSHLSAPGGSSPHSAADELAERTLRNALNERQFVLYYQPILDAGSRQVLGYEALVRWRTPDRGVVSPAEFIPIAERSGFITELSAWVLAEASREIAYRSKTLGISVNISAVSLSSADVVSMVSSALESSGLQPKRLTLEVTESVYLGLTDEVLLTIDRLVEMGVQVAIDDFGTGYSSLSCINAIPFNCVKIDRSFVRKLNSEPRSRVVVQAILDIASGLGMHTIAEGIETEDEARTMAELGVNALQGYHCGYPLPADLAFAALSDRVPVSKRQP